MINRVILEWLLVVMTLISCNISSNKVGSISGVWAEQFNDEFYVEFAFIPKDTLYIYMCDNTGETLEASINSYNIKDDSLFISTMSLKGKEYNRLIFSTKIDHFHKDSFQIDNFWVQGDMLMLKKMDDYATQEDYYEGHAHPIIPLIRRVIFLSRIKRLKNIEVFDELTNTLVKNKWHLKDSPVADSILLFEDIFEPDE